MNLMKTRLIPVLLALALIFSLAGCGASSAPSAPAEITSSPSSVQEAPASSEAASPVDSGPAEESADDGVIRATEEELDLSVRHAEGMNGMVASASPIASKVGVTILERGGNAVDAAVAVAYALGMVESNASGVGGDGYMLVYDANSGKSTFLDYKGEAPAAFTLEFLNEHRGVKGYKQTGYSAVVPGFVAGMEKANELFGTMSMAELLQPTIDYAEKGVPVTPFMAHVYVDYYKTLMKYPETEATFLNDGFPYNEGELFTNQNYANVLKRIAAEGKDAFYTGEIAQSIVDSLAEHDGVMTLQDLANFRVEVREPVSTTYRGYRVVSAPPGAGGAAVIEALNMAEHFDVHSMGHNTPETLHMWAEILKLSAVDRYHYIGDPDYTDPSGMYGITTKSYAADRVKLVNMERVLGKPKYGKVEEVDGAHTTHVSIIDQWGNMVAMTNTVSDFFGCGITVKGCGFFMNNGSFNFSSVYKANQPRPGQKVRSSISPTLIFSPNGSPLATFGTPGGSRIPGTVTQIVSNIVDFGMDMQDAIDAPRIYQNYNDGLYIEGHMDPETTYTMKLKGHQVIERGKLDYFFGGVQGVKIDPETGELHGAADPRRDGKALGY